MQTHRNNSKNPRKPAKAKSKGKVETVLSDANLVMDSYEEFLSNKKRHAQYVGFDCGDLTRKGAEYQLFDWQQHVVRIALKAGRFALFEDCGLGKSGQQLIWADEVATHAERPVLILCPLAVAMQTVAEGVKFGVKVTHIREREELGKTGIYITNYDRLEKFLPEIPRLAGVVLDESSLLKSYDSKMRKLMTDCFARTKYKLCCTATPAPNDYTELGQHAEFLGVMDAVQMLATWFINDTHNTKKGWRLKKHARSDFWRWVGTWAACIAKPSDIGFSDDGYNLPPLEMHNWNIDVDEVTGAKEGELFRASQVSASTLQKEARFSINERCTKAVEIAMSEPTPCIIWCELNDESDLLKKMVPDAVEIRGADKDFKKERAAMWFVGGELTEAELHSIGREPKLAVCGNQNMQSAVVQNIRQTLVNGSVVETKLGRPKKIEFTCEPTTSSIPTNSNAPILNEGTNCGGKSIVNAKSLGSEPGEMRQDGKRKTRKKGKHKDLESSELQLLNSSQCLINREADVQSVDTQIHQNQLSSQSSIIATEPEELGESFVPIVTTDSVTSAITPQRYAEPPNTFQVLISKPEIFGFGMNMQVCTRQVFVGQSWSMERQYQAIRRSYRFGQTQQVDIHFISPSTLGDVRVRVREKFADHETMKKEMKEAAKQITNQRDVTIEPDDMPVVESPRFKIVNGDCVRVSKKHIADESVGLSIFSPPFSSLFTYTSKAEDMSNCHDLKEFMEHFKFTVQELYRVTMSGRECAVHCCDLQSTRTTHGVIELQDFSGETVKVFREAGWLFHSRITIWKSPVVEMQRTKAHGLLYKQLKKDSSHSRVGMPDYLMVFRKPGVNPKPIAHSESEFLLGDWQEIASPVWMTIEQGNVLNRQGSKEANDERHICPLQLDVIERAIKLWSARGDLVYSPFTGIGSEGYMAVKMGRNFVGSELKESYFKDAAQWLKQAESEQELPLELAAAIPTVYPNNEDAGLDRVVGGLLGDVAITGPVSGKNAYPKLEELVEEETELVEV